MKLTEYFIERPLLANLVMIMIILVGGLTLLGLKRATYPTVNFDILKITTTYPGSSAHDVEVNVTEKIENELEEVPNIEKILSNSVENVSLIYVFVDPDADDIDLTKDDVRRAVDRVTDLPEAVKDKPEIEELRSANVPVIEIAIIGKANEAILRKVARDLKDEIKEIPDIMSVEKVGYRDREVKILIDANKLTENYLSFNEVIGAIQNRNVRTSGGNLESYLTEKKIVTFSEFEDPMEVSNIYIRGNFEMQNIPLSDVAEVEDSYEDYDVIPRTNGQTSINLLIRSQGGGDIINISDAIKERIAQFEKNLPKDVSIAIVNDYSYYTDNMLGIVRTNAIMGFFFVLICLVIFLDRYSAIWVAAGIPVSVLGAMAFFPLFDIDINFISLITMVVVLGMLVDDTIVIGENINRHREMGKPAAQAAMDGLKEVLGPVSATVISTILAFIPMFMMTGITGKFVRQMPIVVILTLGFSLFEAVFILPSHLAHSRSAGTRRSTVMDRLRIRYERALQWILKNRKKSLVTLISIPVTCFIIFMVGMKFVLFPYTDIDIFYVVAELDEGASLSRTTEKIKEVEELITKIDSTELVNFTTRVGHHDMDVYGGSAGLHKNWALVAVYLHPAAERKRTSEEIMTELDGKLAKLTAFKKLRIEKFNDGPPIGRPVTVRFVSDDDKIRDRFAQEAMELLKKTPGIKNLEIDKKLGKQELRLSLDHEKLIGLGITVREVANTVRAAYDGVVASELTRGGEEIEFRVRLNDEQRQSLGVLQNLHILNDRNKLIRMGNITTLVPSQGLESLKHYNGRRSVTITADVDEKVITPIQANQKIREAFEERVQTQPGLRLIFGGEEKATQESMQSFYVAFACAMVAIYFLLVGLLNSFLQPLLIMLAIPFGLAGVVLGFLAHGLPLSFMAIIGCLGLIGVVVNDSLVMVSYLNGLRSKQDSCLSIEQIVDGAKTRLRPVLLTTVTTVAGLIPTIFGLGGYEPFLVPIVLALSSGLIIATAGTLVMIPVVYSYQKT